MNPWRSYLGKNPVTSWMLIFVLVFYAMLLWTSILSGNGTESTETGHGRRLSNTQIKEKEDTFTRNLAKNPKLVHALSLAALFLLGAGLALDLHFASKKMEGSSLLGPGLPQTGVLWGLGDVFGFFVLLFFIEAVLTCVEIVAGVFVQWTAPEKDFLLIANSFLRDVLVAALVIRTVRKKFFLTAAHLGITMKDFFRNVWRGIVGYLTIVPPLLLVLMVIAALAKFFSYEPEPQEVVEIYLGVSSQKALLFFTLFVAVVGPVVEEIFFRGFVYQAFRRRYGAIWGGCAAAAVFSAMHMTLIGFVPIFFLGLFLVYLYEKTGSLVPSMTAHIVHNLAMVAFTLGFKALSA